MGWNMFYQNGETWWIQLGVKKPPKEEVCKKIAGLKLSNLYCIFFI